MALARARHDDPDRLVHVAERWTFRAIYLGREGKAGRLTYGGFPIQPDNVTEEENKPQIARIKQMTEGQGNGHRNGLSTCRRPSETDRAVQRFAEIIERRTANGER